MYTAFLFGQAKGRDLWQDPGLPAHFFTRTALAGIAALSLIVFFDGLSVHGGTFFWAILVALGLHGAFMIGHATRSRTSTSQATRNMVRGRFRAYFWGGLVIGVVVPGAIIIHTALPYIQIVSMTETFSAPLVLAFYHLGLKWAVAAVMVLTGLALYEHAYVQAGQSVPQS